MERDYPLTVAGAVADLAQALKKASPHSHAADLSIGHLNGAMMAAAFEMSMRRED